MRILTFNQFGIGEVWKFISRAFRDPHKLYLAPDLLEPAKTTLNHAGEFMVLEKEPDVLGHPWIRIMICGTDSIMWMRIEFDDNDRFEKVDC